MVRSISYPTLILPILDGRGSVNGLYQVNTMIDCALKVPCYGRWHCIAAGY